MHHGLSRSICRCTFSQSSDPSGRRAYFRLPRGNFGNLRPNLACFLILPPYGAGAGGLGALETRVVSLDESRVARYVRSLHKNYTPTATRGPRPTQARSQYTVQGILTALLVRYSGGHCKGERSSRAGAGAAPPASRPHLAPSCGGCYSPAAAAAATALLQPCCGCGGGLRPELGRASDATCG